MQHKSSKLLLVFLLIAIFSIQILSTSELIAQKQNIKDNKVSTSTNNQEFSKTSNNKPLSTNSVNSLNSSNSTYNFSVSNLFNYLKNAASVISYSFVDSSSDYLNTTITVARGLAILKMLGFTGYIISLKNVAGYFDKFGLSKGNGGYPILNGLPDASIMGTYGVMETAQLLNLVTQINLNRIHTRSYLLSKYYAFSNQGGFKEDYQKNVNASIQSTYYAVEALKILGYQFPISQINQINQFLTALWNPSGNYFSNVNDPDQSIIITSFQAISILYDLQQLGLTNLTLWNQVKSGFPIYIKNQQDTTGLYVGGIHDASNTANVDDTGSAISALHILNNFGTVDTNAATQFIIQSQYNGTQFSKDVGGFSSNNGTTTDKSQFSDVKLSYTYYAILGLYSSGYFYNTTTISIQTDYSKANNLNSKTNEILVEQNSTFSAEMKISNFKNYYGDMDAQFQINKLVVESNFTSTNNANSGSTFNFLVINTTNSDFYLGAHNFTAYFSLTNFSIVPVITYTFNGDFVVRLPIKSMINNVVTTLQVSPGTLLTAHVIFDNNTVNETRMRNSILGNVSVTLINPNNTSLPLNNGNNFTLVLTNSTYSYNYTIPNNAVLGDYMVNLTYSNGSKILFYSEQVITVTTSISLMSISSLNNKIYPGSNFNLNFTLEYANGYMNPNVTSLVAFFKESGTNTVIFNTTLVSIGGDQFSPSSSEVVPIGLFMGKYNVSINLVWNSTTTNSSLTKTAFNSSIDYIRYVADPLILHEQLSPAANRTDKNLIYSGDFLNFTANIGIKNELTQKVYLLNSSTTITAELDNTSKPTQVLQELDTVFLNNSLISAYGEIDPNINQLHDVNLTLNLKIKYASSNTYNFTYIYNNKNKLIPYKPTFLLKKANLELDQSSVNFIIGNSTITENTYTTLLVTFKIYSFLNNNVKEYVTGLKLNGTLIIPGKNGNNATEILLPAITSLDTNKSYQLQIPVNSLNVGNYNINITTLNTNIPLGSFNLSIMTIKVNNQIPVENFIALGTVTMAVVFTIIANSINKRKK